MTAYGTFLQDITLSVATGIVVYAGGEESDNATV